MLFRSNGSLQERTANFSPFYESYGDEFIAVLLKELKLLENEFTVAKLRVIALLKDWSKKNIYQQGYPPMPIVIVDLPLYGDEVIEKYISNRIALHREYYKIAKENGVDAMPACSPEERWKKSDTIKIYATPDASKSSKNFELNGTEEENKASEIAAKLFFENLKVTKPNAIMKVISGFDGRCNDYCKVNIHCHYYKNLVAKK